MKHYQYGKITDLEIQKECKKLFVSNYIRKDTGDEIIIKTKDGMRVIFEETRFEHAFTREDRFTKVRSFDYSRARKVLWIKCLVTEQCGDMKVLVRDTMKGNNKTREYYLPERQYLVILDWHPRDNPHSFRFNTAYCVTMAWKREQVEKNFGIK